MCTLGGPLQLRFLSRQEEQRAGGGSAGAGAGAGDAELAFLREYMDAERLFNGHLGVRLSGVWYPSALAAGVSEWAASGATGHEHLPPAPCVQSGPSPTC